VAMHGIATMMATTAVATAITTTAAIPMEGDIRRTAI
jgi:hypothetical protein